MAKKNELSFEDQIKRLENIVSVLDQGNASLNDMMSLYEEGMALIVSCKKHSMKQSKKSLYSVLHSYMFHKAIWLNGTCHAFCP